MTFENMLSEAKMTKTALAERLGLSRVAVSKWKDSPPRYAIAYLELVIKIKLLAQSV